MPLIAKDAPPAIRGCFVTGTDTGVGKTFVAAAIITALRAQGARVAAVKPVVTGTDEPSAHPSDHELLAACTGQTPADVTPVTDGAAVSPHLAAAGDPLDPEALVAHARAAAATADVLVAEGVGGLLVPLTLNWSVRDYAVALGLPVLVVARGGLGTINHTRLTVAAARDVGLQVAGIVLNLWRPVPTPLEQDNAHVIAALTGAGVWTMPWLDEPQPDALAAAAAAWPLDRWMRPPERRS